MGYYYSAAAASASSPTPELLWWKMSDGSGTVVTAAVGAERHDKCRLGHRAIGSRFGARFQRDL